MIDEQGFGWHSWQEVEVDANQEHFTLSYYPRGCSNNQGTAIQAAVVGVWDIHKQCFPFQLTTDNPEAMAHAVDAANQAFNKTLNFDSKQQPDKAWRYFRAKSQISDFFIGNVLWQFKHTKDPSFSQQLARFLQEDGEEVSEKFGNSNWCETDSVDRQQAHFKLYDRVENPQEKEEYQVVAVLAYWNWQQQVFPVEFISSQSEQLTEVKQSLDYFLNELPYKQKQQADVDFAKIWLNLKKHSSSAAQWYQKGVLWRYFED